MAANLKEVRNRIKSVVSTQQITKAMKMVSAAKLRKAQQAIQQLRPYANRLNITLSNILSGGDSGSGISLGKETLKQKPLMIIITSDRGLCGAFNANILKLAFFYAKEHYAEQYEAGNLSFLCIGKKGFDYFRRRFPKATFIDQYLTLYSNHNFEKIAALADRLMIDFQNSTFDQLELYYGRFKNAGTQFPEREQYLPVGKLEVESNVKTGMKADYIFEPNQQQLLEELIPSILQTQLFKCLLDTQASEHGARMTAMDKATENAEDMLGELRINYNKARQESITKELSEIVGGAAALEG
ncbi:MAG: ATP synthase F1 subunit gamma [Saprospiraceae bacterium]|nr:ATP synthase F1 subunit gamma [Saprospiraceae bacterium]MBK8451312.1 ATP synthase F1 subunit gamma [Saprospiraceae bacterium]MBK9220780.1 ATP synthase F1 subunit gamma [Saprospiraceae bacterium]MBK9722375.1 ATP synthase F1 subunit gamma [Saprospiraceae bacterium]